jgi:Protein of unknown function (DUF3828)
VKPWVVLLFPAVLSAQHPSLEAARKLVQDFYTAHFKGEMGFSEATLQPKRECLSPELFKALLAKAREPSSPDVVPDIDGDPFTDSQEYPDAFKVGKLQTGGGGARVSVGFTWNNGNPPRSLTVVLKYLQEGWRIDDLRYPRGGTLRELARPAVP